MLQMTRRREVAVLLREHRVPRGALRLVRGLLVIAGIVREFRGAMMTRGALVVIRGLTVVTSGTLRHLNLVEREGATIEPDQVVSHASRVRGIGRTG